MSQIPEADALRAIDRETFDALRKDPAKLEAHLNGILATVRDRMLKPFQQPRPLSYHKFPKAPPVDMTKLVSMPNVAKKQEQTETTAPSAPISPVTPAPTAPETVHPPAPVPPKTTFSFPSVSRGTLIQQAVVEAPRGIVQNDLPKIQASGPLHTDSLRTDPAPTPKKVPLASEAEKPVVPDLKTPKQADPDAVKKRFEERQAGIDKLFKDKGNLT